MGCDWIYYNGSLIGYGIALSTIFSNTIYEIGEFKTYYPSGLSIEVDKIRGKRDSERLYFGFNALKLEWSKYLTQFHPLVDQKTIPEFDIICESFSGSYETVGYDPVIVWGYNIDDSFTKTNQSDCDKISMDFTFPQFSEEIFTDFMAIFRIKICESSNPVSDELKLKEIIKKETSFRIFGRL